MASTERAYSGNESFSKIRLAKTGRQFNNTILADTFTFADRRRLILVTIAVGIVCILMVVIVAYSAQIRCENNALIESNGVLQGEIDNLNIKINSINNVDHIESVAINRLGMVYPTSSECVHVTDEDAPAQNLASVIKKQAYN